MECNISDIRPTIASSSTLDAHSNVIWGERDNKQIDKYHNLSHTKLKRISFPIELSNCVNKQCSNVKHKSLINNMYNNVLYNCPTHFVCKIQSESDNYSARNNKKKN